MHARTPQRSTLNVLTLLTILMTCFLVSACTSFVSTKTLFGEYRDQFPPVVLSVDSPGNVDLPFNWKETTIGGVVVDKFRPSKDFWRLNVYKFSDGMLVSGADSTDYKSKTEDAVTLRNLPPEQLLRADLDLADDQQGTKGRETFSFMFLLHHEK